MKGPWSTWGLRGTVTASFALGALIVSALFAVGTYLTARHYLMDQRQATALRQAYADASFVLDSLTYLTADELQSVGEELMAILDRYADRVADHAERPAGSKPVAIVATGHPVAPTPSGN